MTEQNLRQLTCQQARIVDAPIGEQSHQVKVGGTFEIPTAYYGATVGLYLAFLGVTFAGFGNPGLVIPMAIFVVFVIGLFGVPAIWTRLKGTDSKPMTLGQFRARGIATATGRLSAREAAIQMLILPVLIVMWGVAVVMIAAIVA